MYTELLTIWSDQPGVSLAIWLAILIFVLYLGRKPAHQLLRSIGRTIHAALRLTARSTLLLANRLQKRNSEVILSLGRDNTERAIEREFHRVNAVVTRDLSSYPTLHRQISDIVGRLETDYHSATDSPPLPPAWLEAVESIANIPRNGDAAVSRILENINKTVKQSHAETQKAYEKGWLERHKLLSGMQPMWRKLTHVLGQVKNTIDGLENRSKLIDEQMEMYQAIRAGDDQAARLLTSSSLTQFFISGLVLIIAILGGVINFQLIAMPMSEMVGGTSQIGPMRTSDVAALVIIMVEIVMGLFLMESLRVTRLFPMIGSMDDKLRKRMIVITFAILAILATVEASLAYMRDLLALDREALRQSLAGVGVVEAEFRWIPSIGQMTMGFILPFALAFVAIPLESFIHSPRTVLGIAGVAVLRTVAFVVRLLGSFVNHVSKTLVSVYDLIILLPLGVEQLITTTTRRRREDDTQATAPAAVEEQ